MQEEAGGIDIGWALGMFAVGFVIFWLTRRRWRIDYFSNTWLWGLLPIPRLPAIAVLLMAAGALSSVFWLLGQLFS